MPQLVDPHAKDGSKQHPRKAQMDDAPGKKQSKRQGKLPKAALDGRLK
jgi:hypothetical protein